MTERELEAIAPEAVVLAANGVMNHNVLYFTISLRNRDPARIEDGPKARHVVCEHVGSGCVVRTGFSDQAEILSDELSQLQPWQNRGEQFIHGSLAILWNEAAYESMELLKGVRAKPCG